MRKLCGIVFFSALAMIWLQPVAFADSCSNPPASLPACSYTVLNSSCKVAINRLNPTTPPTIYMRRGCSVTVTVDSPSAFEDLTLDWKSSTTIVPPDTFQTIFGALSTNVGKFTDVVHIAAPAPPANPGFVPEEVHVHHCETDSTGCEDNPSWISDAQDNVMKQLKTFDPATLAMPGMQNIKAALQPLPAGPAAAAPPWNNVGGWRNTVTTQLAVPKTQYDGFSSQLSLLNTEIANFKVNHPADVARAKILDANQEKLLQALGSFDPVIKKIELLKAAASAIKDKGADINGNAVIGDPNSAEKNYQSQVWVVNYNNKLLAAAQRAAADTLKTDGADLMSSLTGASTKQPIVSITVQFESPQRIEASTGLMVPVTPYHSYAVAAQGTNGAITGNIVQQSNTYVVVPMAFVNVLAKEWILKNKRTAAFGTGGIGYNPSTSTVELGVGGTWSYRALALSGLLDIGRDTKLTGGFTPNQQLGTGMGLPTPTTATYWSFKGALAISVRIPLGGSSSSGSSSGGN